MIFRYFLLIFLIANTAFIHAQEEVPEINWDELQKTKPWEKSEVWEPVPPKVTPGNYTSAPSDAIVLFDGTDLSAWCKPQFLHEGANVDQLGAANKLMDNARTKIDADWTVKDGSFIVAPGTGAIETKKGFGNIQLHLEWLSPVDPGKEGQAYGNSGIFLMGMYEIQVLNSYENKTYSNGQAGSIYKQHIPLVNASRPPGEWQAYDIIFTAPTFDNNGILLSPAKFTAFQNGVLIQNNVELTGPTVYIGEPAYFAHEAKLPLRLQDHGDLVRYRNIWVREL